MPLNLDIDPIVKRLESELMPSFIEFASTMMKANPGVIAETHSNRHSVGVHAFGINCRPVGTSVLDKTTVALVVSVIAIERLSFHAYIVWQASSPIDALKQSNEAATSSYHEFTDRAVESFKSDVLSLLPSLADAVRRGRGD